MIKENHCCPNCGGHEFYFKGTFYTKAIWSEDDEEFIYDEIEPSESELYCTSCDHVIEELEE